MTIVLIVAVASVAACLALAWHFYRLDREQ